LSYISWWCHTPVYVLHSNGIRAKQSASHHLLIELLETLLWLIVLTVMHQTLFAISWSILLRITNSCVNRSPILLLSSWSHAAIIILLLKSSQIHGLASWRIFAEKKLTNLGKRDVSYNLTLFCWNGLLLLVIEKHSTHISNIIWWFLF